jgi:hypothetical protein
MYGVVAVFKHNEDSDIESYTIYDENLFNLESEAQDYLDNEYELLSQACAIDCENEPDLENFYLDDIIVVDMEEFERTLKNGNV